MKKITIISIAVLSIGLASGCGGKDTPFTIDASGHTGTSGDSTVVPGGTDTISEGTTRSGDEVIVPTGSETVSDFGADSVDSGSDEPTGGEDEETPRTPAAPVRETFLCRDPEPLEGYPGILHCIEGYCKNTETGKKLDCPYGVPEGMGPPTVEAPVPGILFERLPGDVTSRIRGVLFPVLPSQHDQDVAHLMNDTFQPDEFTTFEQQVQSRIMAERGALSEDFATSVKLYVTAVLRALIEAERNNGDVFNARKAKLREVIAAFKSGDLLRCLNAVSSGELSDGNMFTSVRNHPDMLQKVGAYLEIQFAEAYKDIAKASISGVVHPSSTLVSGGDAFGLVYRPDGFVDQGYNHIRGLDNADLWYEGTSNWHAVAQGLRSAVNLQLNPEAAAAAAREIEAAARSMREQGEAIVDAITSW